MYNNKNINSILNDIQLNTFLNEMIREVFFIIVKMNELNSKNVICVIIKFKDNIFVLLT